MNPKLKLLLKFVVGAVFIVLVVAGADAMLKHFFDSPDNWLNQPVTGRHFLIAMFLAFWFAS